MKNTLFRFMVFMKVVGLGGAVLIFFVAGFGPMAANSFAKDETVYLAVIDDFSGPFAYSGKQHLNGVKLALKEANYEVLGKKIELITRDTQLKPPLAVRKMREVVQKYHPFFMLGFCSSSVSLAAKQEAVDLKTPIFVEGAATQITCEECVRYLFRWQPPNYAGARAGFATFLKNHPKAKRFYVVHMNNASGRSMTYEQETLMKAQGARIIKTVETPLDCPDFSSHITDALSLNPDAIVYNIYGSGMINFTKQLYEYGVSKKMPIMSGWGVMALFRGMPPKSLENIYFGSQWWHTVDTEWTKNFVDKWKKEYNEIPTYIAASGCLDTWLILQTAERVKSLKAKDLIIGLERFGTFEGPSGLEWVRPWDHQIVHPFYVGRGKSIKEKRYPDDYLEIIGSATEYPNVYPQESTCKFKIRDEDL